MGGCGPDGPQTEAQVARFLVGMFQNQFLGKEKRKKCHQKQCHQIRRLFFFLIDIFFENGRRIKCHQIGMDQKVSPNNNNNGDNFYLIDIV